MTESPKSLNEVRYGMATEGVKCKFPQLEGAVLTILAVSFFDAEFAPGACVQFAQGEGIGWFITHSEFVIQTLDMMKGNEPYQATPTANKSASDRTYYTLE
jgi:hypothetical protein